MIPIVARASAGACDWRRGPAAGVCLRTLGGSASPSYRQPRRVSGSRSWRGDCCDGNAVPASTIAPVLPVLARSRLRSVLVTRCSVARSPVGWQAPVVQTTSARLATVKAVPPGRDAPTLPPAFLIPAPGGGFFEIDQSTGPRAKMRKQHDDHHSH